MQMKGGREQRGDKWLTSGVAGLRACAFVTLADGAEWPSMKHVPGTASVPGARNETPHWVTTCRGGSASPCSWSHAERLEWCGPSEPGRTPEEVS